MRHVVGTTPKYLVLTLAVLTGVAEVIGNAGYFEVGHSLGIPLSILSFLAIGSILGVLALYVGGKLLQWSGKRLGGQASLDEIQIALAWSTVPRIATLPILLLAILLNGQGLVAIGVYALPIIVLLDLWSVILLVICVGEVQRFSIPKSLGSSVLAALCIVLPIAIVAGALELLPGY
jgi:hypothetical protein